MIPVPTEQNRSTSLLSVSAANADQIVEVGKPHAGLAVTGGWDAYEVWRRLIKDVRDQRDCRTR